MTLVILRHRFGAVLSRYVVNHERAFSSLARSASLAVVCRRPHSHFLTHHDRVAAKQHRLYVTEGTTGPIKPDDSTKDEADADAKSQTSSNTTSHHTEPITKEDIAAKAVEYVPMLGWSEESIRKAAEDLHLSGAAVSMFPRGGVELVEYVVTKMNEKLAEELEGRSRETQGGEDPVNEASLNTAMPGSEEKQQQQQQQQQQNEQNEPRFESSSDESSYQSSEDDVVELLFSAMQKRILMIEPFRQTWAQAIALQAMPQNAPTALKQTAELADELCAYIERSTSSEKHEKSIEKWYARRAVIGTLFNATQLAWLSDNSHGYEKTWNMLYETLKRGYEADQVLSGLDTAFGKPASAAFGTLRAFLRSIRPPL